MKTTPLIRKGDRYPFWQRLWRYLFQGGSWDDQRGLKRQSSWSWCGRCGFDLSSNPDTKIESHDDGVHVTHVCGVCDLKSVWDYANYPFPKWVYNTFSAESRKSEALTFRELRIADTHRSQHLFPECAEWTARDWMTALCGEVGEAANFIKKELRDGKDVRGKLTKELADIIMYADLLAAHYGIDLEDAIEQKFNEVVAKKGGKFKLNDYRTPMPTPRDPRDRETIEFLWSLLDNIDSLDDQCKDNDKAFRGAARIQQRRRFDTGITTDGYTLTFPDDDDRPMLTQADMGALVAGSMPTNESFLDALKEDQD